MRSITRVLDYGWTFTRIGETDNGEWLETSTFPTSVHVELLHLKKIPDPVSSASCIRQRDGMYSFLIVPWPPRVGCTMYGRLLATVVDVRTPV